MTIGERIASGLAALGLELDAAARAKLEAYLALIAKWNRVHNLTAVRDAEQMVAVHLLDSLAVVPHVAAAANLLDVGSGGGLPGIPIAIALPSLPVTLLDASHKKAAFLQQARAELDLANVEVVCERVEAWRPGRVFDAVVSRAFSDLADFVSQAAHLLAPHGRLIAMKGIYPFEEIAKIPASHRVASVEALRVPDLEARRHLVLMEAA